VGVTISVQDHSGHYKAIQLERLVWSLRYQALYHFNRSPWVERGYCEPIDDVILVPKEETPPPDTWHMELLKVSPEEGALGWHEDSAFGAHTPKGKPEKASDRSQRGLRADNELPLMKIFVSTCIKYQVEPSEVCSHEMLEAAVDPQVMSDSDLRMYPNPDDGNDYIAEVGDPVQGRGYDVGDPENRPCGVKESIVADFAYPSWWDQPQKRTFTSAAEEFGLSDRVEPFELAPEGYISFKGPDGEWEQEFGSAKK